MALATPGGDRPEISAGVAAEIAPALAPGVELLGAYRGSGYREAPGLVRRDGRTLEVSPCCTWSAPPSTAGATSPRSPAS